MLSPARDIVTVELSCASVVAGAKLIRALLPVAGAVAGGPATGGAVAGGPANGGAVAGGPVSAPAPGAAPAGGTASGSIFGGAYPTLICVALPAATDLRFEAVMS